VAVYSIVISIYNEGNVIVTLAGYSFVLIATCGKSIDQRTQSVEMHHASEWLIIPPSQLLYTAGKRSMSTVACDSAALAQTASRLMLLAAFHPQSAAG
jgi:hypothetical protein